MTTHPAVDPELLHQMAFSFIPSRVLSAGLQLGVFSHIASGKQTAEEVAAAAQASERGIRMLLDALAVTQLLTRNGARYELTPLASRFLVRGTPDYLGRLFEQDELWESWGRLTDVIRTGQPLHRVEDQQLAEQFFPILVQTLHVLHRDRARQMAEALGIGKLSKGVRAVDVGCGSGVWGIAVAEADTQARVTAQDFPSMLSLTREYLQRHGVLDRQLLGLKARMRRRGGQVELGRVRRVRWVPRLPDRHPRRRNVGLLLGGGLTS